jgi:hypothetical protein
VPDIVEHPDSTASVVGLQHRERRVSDPIDAPGMPRGAKPEHPGDHGVDHTAVSDDRGLLAVVETAEERLQRSVDPTGELCPGLAAAHANLLSAAQRSQFVREPGPYLLPRQSLPPPDVHLPPHRIGLGFAPGEPGGVERPAQVGRDHPGQVPLGHPAAQGNGLNPSCPAEAGIALALPYMARIRRGLAVADEDDANAHLNLQILDRDVG